MKRTVSFMIVLCILIVIPAAASAEPFRRNAVAELYSAEGFYVDSSGNAQAYSFHVPQLTADSAAAEEINGEIAERFGKNVESQLQNMEKSYSLWMWNTEWHAYWNADQVFLLVSSDEEGGFTDYGVYGYDYEKECRISNAMILEEIGVSEEEYMENLKEKVGLMFEDMYRSVPEEARETVGYDELYEKTMGWLDPEQPMFIDGAGVVETLVKIASIAGGEWYYHFATPFSYG